MLLTITLMRGKIEMSDFFVVWKVTCLTPRDGGKNVNFLVVDMGDDPNFDCEGCSAEGNHLPPNKEFAESAKRWGHYKELVGRVTFDQLEKLALKDKRGWR